MAASTASSAVHGLAASQPQLSPIADNSHSPMAMDLTNELWLQANGHNQHPHHGEAGFEPAYHHIKDLHQPLQPQTHTQV